MDPVINSVLQSPLARNLNHIATDSTQFTYHVEQNAPPLSLKKGYIDSSQSFVGFDNTYTFTLPQWGYMAKNILRLQYQIRPLQRTHVTPVLPMYHMIEKVELMSHNNVIETLYGDSIMIKHAYYTETDVAATKMMGTLNVPPECGSYVDISALFRNTLNGSPFNPFDHTQWNSTTNTRTVTLFLELPFSFTDNPAMYFDTRFVEFLTVQVKLSSTKHGLPLFQAACAVEIDMGDDNIQLDQSKHKNNISKVAEDADLTANNKGYKDNSSDYYEDKANTTVNKTAGLGYSQKVQGCSKFFYRPFFTRCIGVGGTEANQYADGNPEGVVEAQTWLNYGRGNVDSSSGAADAGTTAATCLNDTIATDMLGPNRGIFGTHSIAPGTGLSEKELDATTNVSDAVRIELAATTGKTASTSRGAPDDARKYFATERGNGLDPFELQLGGRPGSRLPSRPPAWMKGFYPAVDKNGVYACAHSGEPRYLRVGACNFRADHYTVGYWGFLAKDADGKTKFGENKDGISSTKISVLREDKSPHTGGVSGKQVTTFGLYTIESSATPSTATEGYFDRAIMDTAAYWAEVGGKFVYEKTPVYGTKAATDVLTLARSMDANTGFTSAEVDKERGFIPGSNTAGHRFGEQLSDHEFLATGQFYVHINTRTALLERFYAMYPYLNLSNQPINATDRWEGGTKADDYNKLNDSNNTTYGHGHMATDALVVEGSQNNASYEGLPQATSVNMKLLVTYLSLHDRVREQVSMDNFKDNMPATILCHDTFQEYNGIVYGSPDSSWAAETDQTMVLPLRSKNLAYAISIVAYRNRSDAQLVGGGVYNMLQDGNGPKNSMMDVSMEETNQQSQNVPIQKTVGKTSGDPKMQQVENHMDGDGKLTDRGDRRRGGADLKDMYYGLGASEDTVLTRWNSRVKRAPSSYDAGLGMNQVLEEAITATTGIPAMYGVAGATATTLIDNLRGRNLEVTNKIQATSNECRLADGQDIASDFRKGPCVLSDPAFVWPNYKVVENFKTVKPTHVKLSIAGQPIYETAQQTALSNSYYGTTSDSYTPTRGGGQWFVEKDLDNMPFHYNQGPASRGEMGSVARLPNIMGTNQMGGSIQEHCDAHVITFGLNKTDQLSNNGALGLSSATNAQLEMKFAEPCRVSVYVHYHATLQIDSNTGVMSRSLDV